MPQAKLERSLRPAQACAAAGASCSAGTTRTACCRTRRPRRPMVRLHAGARRGGEKRLASPPCALAFTAWGAGRPGGSAGILVPAKRVGVRVTTHGSPCAQSARVCMQMDGRIDCWRPSQRDGPSDDRLTQHAEERVELQPPHGVRPSPIHPSIPAQRNLFLFRTRQPPSRPSNFAR